MAQLQLAVDIGGTFTDVAMVDGASGVLWTAKMPSTPVDPSDGFFEGVDKILHAAGAASFGEVALTIRSTPAS